MHNSQPRDLKSDFLSGTVSEANATYCRTCGAPVEANGYCTDDGTTIQWHCDTCDTSGTGLPDTSPPRVAADGGKAAVKTPYDVLAKLGGTQSDRLQEFVAGDLARDDLTPADLRRPLKLALGMLCLSIEHTHKTEYIFLTESGFVSKTTFDGNHSDWGPIAVEDEALKARLYRGKEIDVRLTEKVPIELPDTAMKPSTEVFA